MEIISKKGFFHFRLFNLNISAVNRKLEFQKREKYQRFL